MSYPIRLVKRHDTTRPNQSCHFADNLLRMGHIDENQASGRKIEDASRQARRSTVAMDHFHVGQVAAGDKMPRQANGLLAPLHSDHGSSRADTFRQKIQTTLRTATDFHRPRALEQANTFE